MLSVHIEQQPELFKLLQQHQEIVLLQNNKPVAKITPINEPLKRQLGTATGLFQLSDDFNAPLADFAEYS
jgi:antitoxin (DNA-binding transcriptional repressor) of toxin-antitoxin stability system